MTSAKETMLVHQYYNAGYAKGYEDGRKEGLAFFLKKEALRHQQDIDKAMTDIETLRVHGVKIPENVDVNEWVEP